MQKKSTNIIVGISLLVAAVHILIGPVYQGWARDFMRGYLIDILLPMNLYLLLQLALRKHFPVRISRWVGAILPLLVGMGVEFLQKAGYDVLGNTYDPLDLLMYMLGVVMGVLMDLYILDRIEKHAE